jgi:hypothetical protein
VSGPTGAGRSLVRRYFEDLLNAGDLGVADEILSPDVSFVGPITPDGIHGLERAGTVGGHKYGRGRSAQ